MPGSDQRDAVFRRIREALRVPAPHREHGHVDYAATAPAAHADARDRRVSRVAAAGRANRGGTHRALRAERRGAEGRLPRRRLAGGGRAASGRDRRGGRLAARRHAPARSGRAAGGIARPAAGCSPTRAIATRSWSAATRASPAAMRWWRRPARCSSPASARAAARSPCCRRTTWSSRRAGSLWPTSPQRWKARGRATRRTGPACSVSSPARAAPATSSASWSSARTGRRN